MYVFFDNIIQYIFNHHSQDNFFSFCVIFAFLLKDLSRNKVPPFQHWLNTSFHLLDGHNLPSFPLLFPCNSIEPPHFSRLRQWNTMKFTLFAGEAQFCLVQWPWNRPRKAIPSLYLQCCSLTRREAAVSSRNWGWVPALRPDQGQLSGIRQGNFSFFSPQNSWKPESNRLRIFLKSGMKIVKINFNRDWLWLWLWIWSTNEAISIVIKTGRNWSIANILTG